MCFFVVIIRNDAIEDEICLHSLGITFVFILVHSWIRKEKDAENANCGDSDNKNSGIPWVLLGGCPTSLHHEEEDTKT